MKRRLLAVIFLVCPPALADAPAWVVEDGSSIAFIYVQDGMEKPGHFASFTADIRFDPADPASAEIAAEIDLASVNAGTQDADDSLKSSDWFNVDLFPSARFKSTAVRAADDGYVMSAVLTIRGRAVPVDLPFTLSVDGSSARATGELTLDRMAFGLGEGFWANPNFIGHGVVVRVDIKAHLAP